MLPDTPDQTVATGVTEGECCQDMLEGGPQAGPGYPAQGRTLLLSVARCDFSVALSHVLH